MRGRLLPEAPKDVSVYVYIYIYVRIIQVQQGLKLEERGGQDLLLVLCFLLRYISLLI